MKSFTLILAIAVLCVATSILVVDGGAVIGIDLGTKWFKVALIKGSHFDLVVNTEGRRKQPTLVGFFRDERHFGRDAERMLIRRPHLVFESVQNLLGLRPQNDYVVQSWPHGRAEWHKRYSMREDERRGTLLLKDLSSVERDDEGEPLADSGDEYGVESLVSMILELAKQTVKEAHDGLEVADCVLTVPAWWTHHQRVALIDAAELAGLNVLSLMNDGSAVALNYALTRTSDELADEKTVLFYDMGAGKTSVTLARYSHVPAAPKSKINKDTVPQVGVLAADGDAVLGGADFDRVLADYLADLAAERFGDEAVRGSPRVMAKLLAQATKTKEVLSANSMTIVMIEGLVDDYDFRAEVRRETFLSLCDELLERAVAPIARVLEYAGLAAADIDQVEVVGGGSRVPAIQQRIADFFGGVPPGKHLNSDEAAVFGATFFGATLSSSFRVKSQYRVRDVSAHAVVVNVTEGAGLADEDRVTQLIRRGNRLGLKKNLSFKTDDANDIHLELQYDNELVPAGNELDIAHYNISGIPSADDASLNMTSRPKIVVSFRLQRSSLVELESAVAEYTASEPRLVVVNTTKEEVKEDEVKEGNDVEEAEAKEDEVKESEVKEDEVKEDNDVEETEAKEDEVKEGEVKEDEVKEDEVKEDKDEEAKDDEVEDDEPEVVVERKTVWKNVKKTRTLKVDAVWQGVQRLNFSERAAARKVLRKLARKEQDKRDLEEARNSLEAFAYSTRQKLNENEEIRKHSTEEERLPYAEELLDVADWLYDEGSDASLTELRAKLRSVRKLYDRIVVRVDNAEKLPAALALYVQAHERALNLTEGMTLRRNITEEEATAFYERLEADKANLLAKLEEQSQMEPHEDPILLPADIDELSDWIATQLRVFRRRPLLKKKVVIEETGEEEEEGKEGQEGNAKQDDSDDQVEVDGEATEVEEATSDSEGEDAVEAPHDGDDIANEDVHM
jgi:hypoxia up-regulated 1